MGTKVCALEWRVPRTTLDLQSTPTKFCLSLKTKGPESKDHSFGYFGDPRIRIPQVGSSCSNNGEVLEIVP